MESVIKLLTRLGFFINFEKASLIPNTSMRFLGFILDSVEMVLKPPEDKVTKALHLIQTFLEFKTFKIREVASLIGVVNHLSHDVDYGKAHIKGLGNDKIDALRSAGEKGFEGGMNILKMEYTIYFGGSIILKVRAGLFPCQFLELFLRPLHPKLAGALFLGVELSMGGGIHKKGSYTLTLWKH